MPVKFIRYSKKHRTPGFGTFNDFAHSDDQLRPAVRKAAKDVIAYAKPKSQTLAPRWRVARGPAIRIGAFSRLSEQVVNDHPAAAAIEFGSGRGRPGSSGDRHQGGYSYPQRILGEAGARVGDLKGDVG